MERARRYTPEEQNDLLTQDHAITPGEKDVLLLYMFIVVLLKHKSFYAALLRLSVIRQIL